MKNTTSLLCPYLRRKRYIVRHIRSILPPPSKPMWFDHRRMDTVKGAIPSFLLPSPRLRAPAQPSRSWRRECIYLYMLSVRKAFSSRGGLEGLQLLHTSHESHRHGRSGFASTQRTPGSLEFSTIYFGFSMSYNITVKTLREI